MRLVLSLSITLFAILSTSYAYAQNSPVVVELFSSQGCVHCPPADALIGELAQLNNVIALNCHVDYMGVKNDSLGRRFCTDRQTEYIKRMGRKSHFTPHMMINGHINVSISKNGRDALNEGLREGVQDNIKKILVTRSGKDAYSFELPPIKIVDKNYKIYAAIIDRPHDITIGSGGNKGKRVVYTNAVSTIIPLGNWNGIALRRIINFPLQETHNGLTVFVQNEHTGKIIAAGQYQKKDKD